MLSGFNTNIRHRSVLFHVQTEDSGRAHPHIISHLYYGGTILSSKKRGYTELLEEGAHSDDEIEAGVKKRMQEQHKDILRTLRRGEFDAVIVERLGDSVFPSGTEKDLVFQDGEDTASGLAAVPAPEPMPEIVPELKSEEVIELVTLVEPSRLGEELDAAAIPLTEVDLEPAPQLEKVPKPESKTKKAAKPAAPSRPAAAPRGKRVSAASKALAQISAKPKKAAQPVEPEPAAKREGESQEFGETSVSKKPLDEVVFDFLVENAKKKPSSK